MVCTTTGKNKSTDTAASFAIKPNNKAQINTGWFRPIGAKNGAKTPQIANKMDCCGSATGRKLNEKRAKQTITKALTVNAIKIFFIKVKVCRKVSPKHSHKFGKFNLTTADELTGVEFFGTKLTTINATKIQTAYTTTIAPKGKCKVVSNKKVSMGNWAVQGISDKKRTNLFRCGWSCAAQTAIVVQLKLKQTGKTSSTGIRKICAILLKRPLFSRIAKIK